MKLQADTTRPKDFTNSAQNNPMIKIPSFNGFGHIKKQAQISTNNQMISCERFTGKTIVSSSQIRANSDTAVGNNHPIS